MSRFSPIVSQTCPHPQWTAGSCSRPVTWQHTFHGLYTNVWREEGRQWKLYYVKDNLYLQVVDVRPTGGDDSGEKWTSAVAILYNFRSDKKGESIQPRERRRLREEWVCWARARTHQFLTPIPRAAFEARFKHFTCNWCALTLEWCELAALHTPPCEQSLRNSLKAARW